MAVSSISEFCDCKEHNKIFLFPVYYIRVYLPFDEYLYLAWALL